MALSRYSRPGRCGSARFGSRMGGAGSSSIFELLPGGVPPSLQAAGILQGSRGEPVTFTRASSKWVANAAGILVDVGSGAPGVDANGFLVEAGATNLLLRSQEFDNAAWSKSTATVTANAHTAPDGTTTADTVETSSAGGFITATTPATANGAQMLSVWLRSLSGTPELRVKNITTGGEIYARAPVAATSAWQRFAVTTSTGVTAGDTLQVFIYPGGTGSGSVVAWGAQLETGSVATSYIKTEGTTASRAADVASVATTGWPTSAGVVEAVWTPQNAEATATLKQIINATTALDGWAMDVGSGTLRFRRRVAGADTTTAAALTMTSGAPVRLRAEFSPSLVRIYQGDTLLASDTTAATVAAISATAGIGCTPAGTQQAMGHLSNLRVAA